LFSSDDSNSKCGQLESNVVKNLSLALITVHEDSSLGVAKGGNEGAQNKRLADTCRTLVSKVALHLETATNTALWETFVSDPLESLAKTLKVSPATAKTGIAYIACLAASGGPRSLRCCLGTCVDPLVEIVSQKEKDDENLAAACYGIGAFFSSCRVSMDRAKHGGIALHPHPLEPYSARAFQALFSVLKDDESTEQSSLPVRIGAVRALESVLLASSSEQFQTEDIQKVCRFVESLIQTITEDTMTDEDDDSEWNKACGLTVGGLLGRSLDTVNDSIEDASEGVNSGVLAKEEVRTCFQNGVLQFLLASATIKKDMAETLRFDRKALALACSCSRVAANSIVSSLLQSLSDALQKGQQDESILACAAALSFVLREGGDMAAQAYHDTSSPNATANDIIEQLSSLGSSAQSKDNKGHLMASVENLALPATLEERGAFNVAVSSHICLGFSVSLFVFANSHRRLHICLN
jgi:hypothetical protein